MHACVRMRAENLIRIYTTELPNIERMASKLRQKYKHSKKFITATRKMVRAGGGRWEGRVHSSVSMQQILPKIGRSCSMRTHQGRWGVMRALHCCLYSCVQLP